MLWSTEAGMVRDDTIVEPDEATEQELLFVHSKQYLGELRVCMETETLVKFN